jgi:hypothetical protein
MRSYRNALFLAVLLSVTAITATAAAAKAKTIAFGKAMPVKLFVGPNEDKSVDMEVRPLYVDGKLKEFTTGAAHEVTDQFFVVQKAFRVNDWLPEDEGKPHKWKWQRGGWLLVDRNSGRTTAIKLPDFDPYYSAASWYRDYAAYCGVSEDGGKLFAVVAQLNQRKPLLRKELGAVNDGDPSQCPAPQWERQPARVTFAPAGAQKFTFTVRARTVEVGEDSSQQ